jgi:hypothetical protein
MLMRNALSGVLATLFLLASASGVSHGDDPHFLVDDNAEAVLSVRFRTLWEKAIAETLFGGKPLVAFAETLTQVSDEAKNLLIQYEQLCVATDHLTASLAGQTVTIAGYGDYSKINADKLGKAVTAAIPGKTVEHKVFGDFAVLVDGREGQVNLLIIGDTAICYRSVSHAEVAKEVVALCGRMKDRRPPLVNKDIATALQDDTHADNLLAYAVATPPNNLGLFFGQIALEKDVLDMLGVGTFVEAAEAQKAEEELVANSRRAGNAIENTLAVKSISQFIKQVNVERTGQLLTVKTRLSLGELVKELPTLARWIDSQRGR